MSEVSIDFYVERNGEEIELEIIGYVEPYVAANLRGHPDTWSPSEGGSSSIETILLNGNLWTGDLTDKETLCAEEELYVQYQEDIEVAADLAAEAKYEMMRGH